MTLKLAGGGRALPSLVSYEPVLVTGDRAASRASSAEASSSSKNDLTTKDTLKLLEHLDGLPNEMAAIQKALRTFQIDASMFGNTSAIESQYAQIQFLIKNANFNKKQYDEAFNIVKSNGGINEAAINERGEVLCRNRDNDFKLLKPEEIKESGYVPVTNSEILKYRAYEGSLVNDHNLLGIVNNGIGMASVNQYVNDVIQKLGTDQNSEEGFFRTGKSEVIGGLKAFQTAATKAASNGEYNATIDNLYKYKYLEADQADKAVKALQYLYVTMPENAKSLLKVKSGKFSDEGAMELLEKLVTPQLSSNRQFGLSVDTPTTTVNADGTSKKGGGSSPFKMDPVSLLQNGYGQKMEITIQTAEGGAHGITVPTVRMPITTKDGKSIGIGTLSDVAESGFAGYLNLDHASMGGVMIDPSGFQNVAINGTSLYTAYLPIDQEEFAETGNIKPDIGLLKRYKEAQDIIATKNITKPEEINQVYQDHNLPVLFNENGDVLQANYQKFGIINGTAIDQAFAENAEVAEYLHETTDAHTIQNVLNILQKGRGKDERIQFNEKTWVNAIGLGSYDHVYQGTIFIPVNEDYFTSTAAFGNYLSPEAAMEVEAKQEAKPREDQAKANYNDPGQL